MLAVCLFAMSIYLHDSQKVHSVLNKGKWHLTMTLYICLTFMPAISVSQANKNICEFEYIPYLTQVFATQFN